MFCKSVKVFLYVNLDSEASGVLDVLIDVSISGNSLLRVKRAC
jgi:hypothetical protein